MSRNSGGQVLGFRYYMSMLMGICRGPVNEIVEFRVGDRSLTLRETNGGPHDQHAIVGYDNSGQPIWGSTPTLAPLIVPGSANAIDDNAQVYVDNYELFGGERKEGGIIGLLDLFFGGAAQTLAASIHTRLGGIGAGPMYRGVVTAFFDGMIAGVNPYPKTWQVRVRRTNAGWDGSVFQSSLAKIELTGPVDQNHPTSSTTIHAMNGVHIVYEALTNRVWGRGLPANRIDTASWAAAAQTLYNEGFGLCLRWNRSSEIQSFAAEILETIAANTYQDRTTGKIVIRLIRNDYLASAVPLFDSESGLLEISEATFGAPGEAINEVVVTWRDPVTGDERKSRAQNIAAIQNAGGAINSTSRSYIGIPTADIASRVAQRELRLVSVPVRRFSLTLDRRGWQVYPGSVIRVRDLRRNIPATVVRVASVMEGGLQSGRIEITAMQDVFAMPESATTGSQGSGWVPPITTPCLGRMRTMEMPYFWLARNLPTAEFNTLNSSSARLGVVVEEGQTLNTSYLIAVRSGAPEVEDAPMNDSYYCGYSAWTSPPPPPPPPAVPTAMTVTFTAEIYMASRSAPYFDSGIGGMVADIEIGVRGTTVYTLTSFTAAVDVSPQAWDYVVHTTRMLDGFNNDDAISEATGLTPGAGVVEVAGPLNFQSATCPQTGRSINYAGLDGTGTVVATHTGTTPFPLASGLRVPFWGGDGVGDVFTMSFTLA